MSGELEDAKKPRDSNDTKNDYCLHIVLSKHEFEVKWKDGAEIYPVHCTLEKGDFVTAEDEATEELQREPNDADDLQII